MQAFEIRDLWVTRAGRRLLHGIALDVPSPGLLAVLGDTGAGKSTLARALVAAAPHDRLQVSGQVLLDGRPLHEIWPRVGVYPPDLAVPPTRPAPRQDPGVHALLDLMLPPRPAYVLDEPTAGLSTVERRVAIGLLRSLACRSLVLLTTGDRSHCMALGGRVALLDAGRVTATVAASTLFARPRAFDVDPGRLRAADHATHVGDIWWVVPGLLGSVPRQTPQASARSTYAALAAAQVGHLVSLDADADATAAHCAAYRIAWHHAGPPSTQARIAALCRLAETAIGVGEGIVFQDGERPDRTAMVLAAVLVWHGEPVDTAIDLVRLTHPQALSRPGQRRFLERFTDRIGQRHRADPVDAACR